MCTCTRSVRMREYHSSSLLKSPDIFLFHMFSSIWIFFFSEVAFTQQLQGACENRQLRRVLAAPARSHQHSSCPGGCAGYFALKHGVNVAVSSQIRLPHLLDSFCFSCYCLFYVGVRGYQRCSLGEFLSICKTPQRLQGIENATRAYIHKVARSKLVKFQFWVNCPFKRFHP